MTAIRSAGPMPSSRTPSLRKPSSALRSAAQPQRRQAGAGKRVAPQVEAPDLLVAGLAEAGAEQPRPGAAASGPSETRSISWTQPLEAVGRRDLEGAGREVVAQRRLAQGPGDDRPRRRRFAEPGGDGVPVGALESRREARPDAEAERVGDQRRRRPRRRRGARRRAGSGAIATATSSGTSAGIRLRAST